jgi:hypothetical protein
MFPVILKLTCCKVQYCEAYWQVSTTQYTLPLVFSLIQVRFRPKKKLHFQGLCVKIGLVTSLFARCWKIHNTHPRPNNPLVKNKSQRLLVKLYPHSKRKGRTELHKDVAQFVKKLVSFAKIYGLGLDDCLEDCDESWESWICSRHDSFVLLFHNNLQKGPATPSFRSQSFQCSLCLLPRNG